MTFDRQRGIQDQHDHRWAFRRDGFYRKAVLFLVALTVSLHNASASPATLPVQLRCEYRENALGVDSVNPHLSWILESQRRGAAQRKYHLLVASSARLLATGTGDLWDTGTVVSDATNQIEYAGKPLHSYQECWWKVQVVAENGAVSPWSQAATWTMGILAKEDWRSARWIGAKPTPDPWSDLIGYHAAETTNGEDTKWVQVDLGRIAPLSSVRLYPVHHAGKEGFGFPLRFKIEASSDPDFRRPTLVADETSALYPNPGLHPVTFPARDIEARFVRVTATQLWKRDATVYAFALARLEVDLNGTDLAAGAPVTAKDSSEFSGWGKAALTNFDASGAHKMRTDSALLRRDFLVKPNLKRALAYVCGLGQYELSVNGRKAGSDVLAPGWTKYDKTCLYDTRDITGLLHSGSNAIGLLLGNGMYNVHGGGDRYTKFTRSFGPRKAICLIRLEFVDGSSQAIVSDDAWQVAPGPITFSSVYGGEDYDARLLPAGWNRSPFDASRWDRATLLDGPGGELRGLGSAGPPIVTFETLEPVVVKRLKPGITVYDLGQNAAIMPRVSVSGPAGSVIKIVPSELIHPDGALDRASVGDAPAYWQYTLSGSGHDETYFSKFFYHGCRYLQVELTNPGGGALPDLKSLAGIVIGSASAPVGQFSCSNDLFNKTYNLIRWAQRSNIVSVMTDCPHRERLGWLEEDHLNGPALRYNFDLNALFAKIENDMADSQTEDGLIPSIAPEYPIFGGGFRDSPEWGSAFLLVPWQQYEFTGDATLLKRNYTAMKRYVSHLTAKSVENIVDYGLGDWYDIGPNPPGYSQLTPVALTATAFYYQDSIILSQAAALLKLPSEAEHYRQLAEQIKTAFNRRFWNTTTQQYATGSQTSNSIPLVMGLVPAGKEPVVVDAIVDDIHRRGGAFTAGDVGYRYLLKALAQENRSDVIFAMNNQSERPGYGYQLRMGATSLTEAWNALRSSSQNHFMLGQIVEWFYGDLAGIGIDPDKPGFKHIIIRPAIVGDLTEAKASYNSIHGTIKSEWKRAKDTLTVKVTVPPNTTATVYMPTKDVSAVLESGSPAVKAPCVKLLSSNDKCAVYAVGSGHYSFCAPFKRL